MNANKNSKAPPLHIQGRFLKQSSLNGIIATENAYLLRGWWYHKQQQKKTEALNICAPSTMPGAAGISIHVNISTTLGGIIIPNL